MIPIYNTGILRIGHFGVTAPAAKQPTNKFFFASLTDFGDMAFHKDFTTSLDHEDKQRSRNKKQNLCEFIGSTKNIPGNPTKQP